MSEQPILLESPYPFTAHNIDLGDGQQTFPEEGWLLEDGRPCQAALRTLRTVFGPEEIAKTSVVDLGCLEGGYTVAFARAGFLATGIEARDINIAKCEFVASRLEFPNLAFVQSDVRELSAQPSFDAIFCSGLLYHLDEPTAFLRLAASRCRRLLILQTHFATEDLPEDPGLTGKLSPLTEHEGNLGRWYAEFPEDASKPQIAEAVWASWGNYRSFWIEKRHLLQTLRDVGFDTVYEQYDFLEDVVRDNYISWNGRGMFVAVKS